VSKQGLAAGSSTTAKDMIATKVLKKSFRTSEGVVNAVNGIDLVLERGVVAAIIGPSGSGKSTLLNLLGTLDTPSDGEIYIDGIKFHNLSEGEATRYRRKSIGFIFQSYNLMPNLSALENVELPMEYTGVKKKERQARAIECLRLAELPEKRYGHRPAQLSGGEQQRVAVARALVNDPFLILADEPTGSLDSATGKQILELLGKLAHKERKTVIIVTHDHEIAARADVVLKLKDGMMEEIKYKK